MGEGMEYKARKKVVSFGNKNLMGAMEKSGFQIGIQLLPLV
jgi:hypothetical protein